MPPWTIRRAESIGSAQREGLRELLCACVERDESLGFLRPMTPERAGAYWETVDALVRSGDRALLLAEDDRGVCGGVQMGLALPENQPHRADLMKMMVHPRARRQGLGAALVRAAEALATEEGRDLLVLDAVTGGDAARLYQRMGWVKVGDIPRYALTPEGAMTGTTVFYRDLSGGGRS